jgi:tetratricopeptide (TPR) repeat protein
MADSAASKNDDGKALAYLSKLNYIAQNARNYLLAAQIYEREDKLDLAIEQIRKALSLDARNQLLSRQLSTLLTRRGKELMDAGNNEAGYAYLQQAKSFDASNQLPDVTLRKLTVSIDSASHCPRVNGEVWNPTDKTINSVNLRAELWDTTEEKLLWSKDTRLVDEFVPPLTSKQSKPFEFLAAQSVKANGKSEFRIFLEGTLYKAYPIGKADRAKPDESPVTAGGGDALKSRRSAESANQAAPAPGPAPAPAPAAPTPQAAMPRIEPPAAVPLPGRPPIDRSSQSMQQHPVETSMPPTAPTPGTSSTQAPGSASTAEEKTMKDLDF